jgi:hypothetical protein
MLTLKRPAKCPHVISNDCDWLLTDTLLPDYSGLLKGQLLLQTQSTLSIPKGLLRRTEIYITSYFVIDFILHRFPAFIRYLIFTYFPLK